jgi:hypothetical protein
MKIPYSYTIEQMVSVLVQSLYKNIDYIDPNGDYKKPRVIFGNGRKDVIEDKYIDDRSTKFGIKNILPAISISMSGGYEDIDELRLVKSKKIIMDSNLRGYNPIPKRLTFNGLIETDKLRTMYNIMEQLDIVFDQQHVIDVKYPILNGMSISTQFLYEFGSIDDGLETSEEDDDTIRASFTITVEPVWLFKKLSQKGDFITLLNITGYTFVTELPNP